MILIDDGEQLNDRFRALIGRANELNNSHFQKRLIADKITPLDNVLMYAAIRFLESAIFQMELAVKESNAGPAEPGKENKNK